MDSDLQDRLRAVGIDPDAPGDPDEAWGQLHDAFGTRATLLDRYALEATARGIAPDQLSAELRSQLARDVLETHSPGLQFVSGSARRPDPIIVVAYDPAWPERFEAWRVPLAAELGSTARRIDHVGSTAVPGLAAKPVIDIQVSVATVADEDAYVPAIERAGVAFRFRESGHRYFRPADGRPRDVQVHVCEAGSKWEQNHLLFRDLLRADAAARDAYSDLKRRLALQFRDDRVAYNEAKTAFILDALERSRA